jgi:ABC-2 type transport system ATP-binding protein
MPEAVPLYPEMRVEEYLSFRAEIKGVPRARRRDAVVRSMEQADVKDVARRIVGELSKGYKQRVGLADALVSDPELLILDEPTAGLDPNQILQVRELIKSLGKKHTVFLSTHILSEVEAICSRVVIIAKGRIAAEGTPEEIRARMAGQGREAVVLVRGLEEKVREVFARIDGVAVLGEPAKVESDVGGGIPVLRFTLDVSDAGGRSAERAESLVAECVSAKLGVRGIELRGKSLEAIFRELTEGEPKESASSATKKKARRSKDATDVSEAKRDDEGASS